MGHHEVDSSVVDSILNDKPHMLYGEEGKKSLEVILAIYESIETGKVIKFPHTATHTKLGKWLNIKVLTAKI